MTQLEEFLESMRRSKAMNESIRDTFLRGELMIGSDGIWEKPAETAAEYDRRAQRDQQIIEVTETGLARSQD